MYKRFNFIGFFIFHVWYALFIIFLCSFIYYTNILKKRNILHLFGYLRYNNAINVLVTLPALKDEALRQEMVNFNLLPFPIAFDIVASLSYLIEI